MGLEKKEKTTSISLSKKINRAKWKKEEDWVKKDQEWVKIKIKTICWVNIGRGLGENENTGRLKKETNFILGENRKWAGWKKIREGWVEI